MNNPPAFPIATVFNPHGGDPINTGQMWDGNGMTLRDYFAAAALPQIINTTCTMAVIGAGIGSDTNGMIKPDAWANAAYEVADAMLAERQKNL